MRRIVVTFQAITLLFLAQVFGRPIQLSAGNSSDGSWNFTLTDSEGRSHSPAEWKDSKAVALLFIGADCPISNAYAPEINRTFSTFAGKHVAFYLVHSDPEITAEQARKYSADYGYHFTVLLDTTQVLAKRLEVTITPTAVVLSPEGELLYKGRIDNRYIGLGQQRDTVTERDLRDALVATLAGKPVAERFTKPVGCFLPPAGR